MINYQIANSYIPILLFIIVATLFALIMIALPMFIARKNQYKEKVSQYECGVRPSVQLKGRFNVPFYLIGVLFMIFDIEICFLFPWALVLNSISLAGFISGIFFLIILGIGLILELKSDALDMD